MASKFTNEISNQIDIIMKEKKLKGREVAKKSGIAETYISEIKLGNRTPTIDTLNNVCNAIGIDIHVLFTKIYLEQGGETKSYNYEKIKEGIDELKLKV